METPFTMKWDMEDLREVLAGREAKLLEVFSSHYGVGLKWRLGFGTADAGRLELHAWSDFPELIQNLDEKITAIKAHPKQLDEVLPFNHASVDISACYQTVIGDSGMVVKWLQRELGVTLKTERDLGRVYLEGTSVDPDLLSVFELRMRQIVSDPVAFQREINQLSREKIHIFVDASNILIGSQRDPITEEEDYSIRLDAKKLLDLVAGLRTAVKKNVIGSNPSENSPFWERWRSCGWTDIRILDRVTVNGRNVEQAVDDCLHAAMSTDICCTYPEQRTLVLLTGDGNANKGRTNFPAVVEQALLRGWIVELWSWGHSMHCVYDRFKASYPQHFFLRALDQHREHLTYRRATPTSSSSSSQSYPSHGNGHSNTNRGRSIHSAGAACKPDDFEIVAAPDEVAKRLHKFICATSADRRITAFDLSSFYEKHPECRAVLREQGVSVFCRQDYARSLLRWDYGSHFAGKGLIHALSGDDLSRTSDSRPSAVPSHPFSNPDVIASLDKKARARSAMGSSTSLGGANSFPEFTAQCLHSFVLAHSPDHRCINAADLGQFYAENPECEELIAELRLSSFCAQPYARHLLRWEHNPKAAGCGRVHAIGSLPGSGSSGFSSEGMGMGMGMGMDGGISGIEGAPAVSSRRRGPTNMIIPLSSPAGAGDHWGQGNDHGPGNSHADSIRASATSPRTGTGDEFSDSLTCPISLDVMRDPVITPHGYSFEHAVIRDWLLTNDSCPITRRPLRVEDLVENRILKQTIDCWWRAQEQKKLDDEHKNVQMRQLQELQQQVDELLMNTRVTSDPALQQTVQNLLQTQQYLSGYVETSPLPLSRPAFNFPSQYEMSPSHYAPSLSPPLPAGSSAASNPQGDLIMQQLRQQSQWLDAQKHAPSPTSSGVHEYSYKAIAGVPFSTDDTSASTSASAAAFASVGDSNDTELDVIPVSMICPTGPSCRNPERCPLYHWPTRLCDNDTKLDKPMCSRGAGGVCPFLHTAQIGFIVRDANNKMMGIRRTGFATVPGGGKRPLGSGKSSSGSTLAGAGAGAGAGASAGAGAGAGASLGAGAGAASAVPSECIAAADLCTAGYGCKGRCGKLHWPNKMCNMDDSCARYPTSTCSFLHTRQKKYVVTNADGSLRAVKKVGLKTLPNEGKK